MVIAFKLKAIIYNKIFLEILSVLKSILNNVIIIIVKIVIHSVIRLVASSQVNIKNHITTTSNLSRLS
ncbi:MAG: hypothetical protein U9Q66_01400 [Patescibacteria group bacterium]|nr:hypothetical protein [Patescibacteria group bacterium]